MNIEIHQMINLIGDVNNRNHIISHSFTILFPE